MQDRKKIYSEQLLQIHTDSKKRNPEKEIYATGYVIELKKDCYFAGFQDGKILCRSFEYARYFSNTHSAEQFVKKIPWICRIKMQSLQGGLGACRSRIRARMEGKPEAL